MTGAGLDSAEVRAARPACPARSAAWHCTVCASKLAAPSRAVRPPAQARCARHLPQGAAASSQVCSVRPLRSPPGSAPRARTRSRAPGARPQAEQAAYLSVGGRHMDSPAAWAEYMALTGSPAEPLAVAHLPFYEPEAALGACAPAGVCPPAPPRARRRVGRRRPAARPASRSGPCTRPMRQASPRAGRRSTCTLPAPPAAARRARGGRGAAPGPPLSRRASLHDKQLYSFTHWMKPCHAICMHPALRASCGSLTRAGGWRARRSRRRAPARGTFACTPDAPQLGPGGVDVGG
jgi:hypothetical protein